MDLTNRKRHHGQFAIKTAGSCSKKWPFSFVQSHRFHGVNKMQRMLCAERYDTENNDHFAMHSTRNTHNVGSNSNNLVSLSSRRLRIPRNAACTQNLRVLWCCWLSGESPCNTPVEASCTVVRFSTCRYLPRHAHDGSYSGDYMHMSEVHAHTSAWYCRSISANCIATQHAQNDMQ